MRSRSPPIQSGARFLKLPADQVLPASTGVIGVELTPTRLSGALPRLAAGLPDGFARCRPAIMTTDKVPEDGFRRSEVRPRRGADRGNDQRLRHDPTA